MTFFLPLSRRRFFTGLAIALVGPSALAQSNTKQSHAVAGLQFDNTAYFHRWSKEGQHEFTPEAQTDLHHWKNMVTINRHQSAQNGEQLAQIANRIIGNYRKHGRVLKAASKPAMAGRPAEHLMIAAFGRDAFMEVAFTRVFLSDGVGFALTYSQRIYGANALPATSEWLLTNGPRIEAALLGWADSPKLAALTST